MIHLYFQNILGGRWGLGSILAFLIFVIFPLFTAYYVTSSMNANLDDFFSPLISVFSILSAMLFASQIAAFNVFNFKVLEVSNLRTTNDDIATEVEKEQSRSRIKGMRLAFRRINAGISMLTIFSILIAGSATLLSTEILGAATEYLETVVLALAIHVTMVFLALCYQVFTFFDVAYTEEDAAGRV